MPQLSVVVTTKDRLTDLLKCVDSLVYSSYKDFELVIVDDNSKDATRNLTPDSIDHHNTKIIHTNTTVMMVSARNIGLKNAMGDHVLFVDDDNIVDSEMIATLLEASRKYNNYLVLGPSMYYSSGEKYLDFQKINLFTGKTVGLVDTLDREICDSDGVPNVFLIKRKAFDICGYFDESLIQTYTEPDFAFRLFQYGYRVGIVPKAKTVHNIQKIQAFTPRFLGGAFKQKAYCLMRNRCVLIRRYGRWYNKFVYLVFFSWLWPLLYSLIMLKCFRFDLIGLYWLGWYDGVQYFIFGKLKNSLK